MEESRNSPSSWLVRRKSRLCEGRPVKTLNDLPEEIVLFVASFLNVTDLLSLCNTNRYLYHILSTEDAIWRKFIRDHVPCVSPVLQTSAKRLTFIRSPLKQSEFKLNYLLHRKTQRNWSAGNFEAIHTLSVKANFSRPPRFMEFNPTKIGGLDYSEDDEIGYFYTLQVWDVTTRTSLSLPWRTQVWSELKSKRNLHQVNCLIVDGTVAVIHLGPYRLEPVSMASCDHAIVALDFANGNQLEDLWQLMPPSRNVEWSLFNIKDKLFRLDESAGHFKMEQIDMNTGQILRCIDHEDHVLSNSQYIVKDDLWLVAPLLNAILWRKVDILVLDSDEGTTKFLAPLDKPIFTVPKLIVRSGKILTLLDDWRIPLWCAWTGNLLMIVSKNNAMLNPFASDNFQARPCIVKSFDESKEAFDVVILSLTEDRQVRKVTSFVEVDSGFKFVANRSFKFENIDTILDVFVIHDNFFVVYVTYVGWLKLAITPMLKLPNEITRKTKTIKLFKVRELTFARKVHLHATPNLAIIKTPDKIHILDFSSQDTVRKKSFTESIKSAFKGMVI